MLKVYVESLVIDIKRQVSRFLFFKTPFWELPVFKIKLLSADISIGIAAKSLSDY